ncbi:MAG: transposase, partial [Akkermansia sp.]|nr:transposase [Akkermansia sp.]
MKEDDLPQIFRYIGGIIRSASGFSYTIGGRPDHIHILTTLPISMTVPDFVRTIKASSSKWIKQLAPEYKDFSWQEGYGAFSVSESVKHNVVDYISNQKHHHQHRSAYCEFIHFLEKNGICTDFVPHQ